MEKYIFILLGEFQSYVGYQEMQLNVMPKIGEVFELPNWFGQWKVIGFDHFIGEYRVCQLRYI